MLDIRSLTEQEFKESLALSQYAFQYEVPKEQIESRLEKLKKYENLGEFEGNTLLSKLHFIPFEIFIGEKQFAMGGVAGVATWPEHRRNRSVARLLSTSLQMMKERGQTVSMLHPFNIAFYRKFGWELTAVMKKVTIETKNLRFMKEVDGKIRRLSKDDPFEVVNAIYESYAKLHVGMLKRDDMWWADNIYTPGYQTGVYFDKEDTPTGYILYKVKDNLIDVQEFIYLNHEARRGLWNFICQHDSMVDKAKIILPESDELPFLLHNPKTSQELIPYFMSRIVDVAGFLDQYQLSGSETEFAVRVSDPVAEWNNGVMIVDGTGARFSTDNERAVPMVETDIQTLTAMFLGSHRPAFLYECERVVGDEATVAALEKWLPISKPAFLDFF